MQKETELQTQVLRFLDWTRNQDETLSFFRLYNGPKLHAKNGKIQFTKNPTPGLADLVILSPDAPSIWIELKSQSGRQSPEQKRFQEDIERSGHIYAICKSIDDVEDALQEYVA